ncbi:carboxylesterase family protein-like protein, partial [Aureobasidium melanogenum]
MIFSDFEEDFRDEHIFDALDGVSPDIVEKHKDFELYRNLRENGRAVLNTNDLSGSATEDTKWHGKVENPGWKLDKWKFLPMVNKTLHEHPDKKWYIFMEADSYILWASLLEYLAVLDPSKPHYTGSIMFIGDTVFAHGGSGFIVSQPAMRMVVEQYAAHKAEIETYTDGHWAGDCVLGKVFTQAGVKFTDAWPVMQGDYPGLVAYARPDGRPIADPKKRVWCYPTVSYHHVSPDMIDDLWSYEQHWLDQKPEETRFLRHKDIFKQYILPRMSADLSDWDNESDGEEATVGSFDECRVKKSGNNPRDGDQEIYKTMSESETPNIKAKTSIMAPVKKLAVLTATSACLPYAIGAVIAPSPSALSNSQSSLTLLYQNNLNFTDDINHISAILLDPSTAANAATGCAALNETLISQSALQAHSQDFVNQLSYIIYAGRATQDQKWHIASGQTVEVHNNALKFAKAGPGNVLPVLCTQSSQSNMPSNAVASASNEIKVASSGNTYVGFRNKKSWRFQGIPFANQPERFAYSTLYSKTGQTIDATKYGPDCAQPYESSSSEDCLFLNIQTPYIPKAGSMKNLRPVHFWIYGGGFTGGSGASAGSDGGQLASREDIVVVEINYRLTTLGFLAIPGTNITGNYGISDQVTGLDWVLKNIASFGGDPNKIVINGESAGAGSVRTLLGSPKAIGKFRGSIAMSNLGGGVDLGLTGDYATTYSSFLTPAESYARSEALFGEIGCNQTTLDARISCLRAAPAQTIVNAATVARYVVQDGTYVDTETLDVYNRNGSAANVNTIWGTTANDGASFSTYPTTPVTSELAGIMAALGISQAYAQSIIDSGLFPYYDTGNVTLDSFNVSQRVATDNQFRCIDEATVYAGVESGAFKTSYFYQMQRTSGGYDPNHLGGPPVEPGYPYGNPEKPYFKLHGSDMPWVFGNLNPLRDANDLKSVQLESGYFAAFVRSLDPNPPASYLQVRGYTNTTQGVKESGPWQPVANAKGPMKLLDFPSLTADFQDLPQCAFLNYSINYYIDGGM